MKRIFCCYIFLLICIIFATKILGIQIPIVVIDIIILLFLLLMSKKCILYTMIFLLPLSVCFDAIAYIWMIYIVVLFLKQKRGGDIPFVLCTLVFLVLELFAHFYYGISELSEMIGYLSGIILFVYLIIGAKSFDISSDNVLRIYCVSVPLLVLFYFLSAIVSGNTDVFEVLFVDGMRFGGTAGEAFSDMSISLNANSLAYYCISEIAMVMVLLKNGILVCWQKYFYIILMIVTAIFGILTGSRAFVVVLAVCVILFWFSSLKNGRQIIVSSAILLAICGVIAIALNSHIPSIEFLIERFERSDVASMNGRTDILEQYLDKFWSNDSFLFFGSGVTNYRLVYGFELSIHNGIIQALICYGLFGFAVFCYIVMNPVVNAIKNKQSFYKFIPLISCFLFVQTIQLLNPYILLFPFAISYLAFSDGRCLKISKEVNNE